MVDTLHLQQSSNAWHLKPKEAASDFDTVLSRGADVVGFTEVYDDIDNLKKAAQKHGYRLAWGTKTGKAETVLAIKDALPLTDHGSILVNPAEAGKPPAGGHSARYATWAAFEWAGNDVFVVEAHWTTGNTASRNAERKKMSDTIAQLIAEHSKKSAIGFWMGDLNADDRKNNDGSVVYTPLEAGGLVTIWDELQIWTHTHGTFGPHGGTIDIIGSYDKDSRVKATQAKVWPKLNSDHRQVSAWYEVKPRHQAFGKHPK